MTERLKTIRDWMFKGLLFEADAEKFRQAGIRIGTDQREVEARLLEEALAPFPLDMRNDALQMARLYAMLYCFENSVRQLIKERLQDSMEPSGGPRAFLKLSRPLPRTGRKRQ